MDNYHEGDSFETHIGSVSGPVHTGKGDIIIENWRERGITREEVEALGALFDNLRSQVMEQAPPELEEEAQAQMESLEEEVTAREPDVSKIERVRKWFAEHLPSAVGAVTSVLVNPIVGKVVEAAGELAADELRRQFGQSPKS